MQWAKWTWSAMKGAGEDELQGEDDVQNEEIEEDDEEEERNLSFRQVASHDSMTKYQQALGWAGLTLSVLLPAHTQTYTHIHLPSGGDLSLGVSIRIVYINLKINWGLNTNLPSHDFTITNQ